MNRGSIALHVACAGFFLTQGGTSFATESAGAERYHSGIAPILEELCFDCHGDGMKKGSLALDKFATDEEMLNDRELWWKVIKNIRAGIMPPKKKQQLTDAELDQILDWVKADVFNVTPEDPDPGRVTVRRLNRIEYRNTIRDLMGIDFDTELEFPPDDTGYGFDNIGDVLSVSPLLLEKYLAAAETIVSDSVPMSDKVPAERRLDGSEFRMTESDRRGNRLSFYEEALVQHEIEIEHAGDYRFIFESHVAGQFEFDPGRCRVVYMVDGKELVQDEFGWVFSDDPDQGKTSRHEVVHTLTAGRHQLSMQLTPLVPVDQRLNRLKFGIRSVTLQGPEDPQHWVAPANYDRFFPDGPAPAEATARRDYATQLIRNFAYRAYRRPVEPALVDKLVSIAEQTYTQPDKTFEQGISRAMVGMLASPRFLFRVERDAAGASDSRFSYVDEYALASRLSYFLWSTMPDAQLFELAEQGKLREQLSAQVERMLKDPRSAALIQNFTGQWLQVRNVDHTPIEPLAALGFQEEMDALEEEFGQQLWPNNRGEPSPELLAARERFGVLRELSDQFNRGLRNSMRRETELLFEHVMREDRSILDFIDSDYTFLNQALAKLYGIEGIEGNEMRLVKLPADSPRGGVLTQGTMLMVTSNPTRTSPVKRGLFILENILGTPTPPPPPDIPTLEESAKDIADEKPTLREMLAKHREDALCSSCHSRIDPLGLAFENFTALGTWRDKEADKLIDASGKLISGEEFVSVQELKTVLKEKYRTNFYRCFTEKLLTYALGRGLEYYDEHTVDVIVDQLEQQDGRFSVLISGIIQSAPFQKRRNSTN